jgi:hypothetical protein
MRKQVAQYVTEQDGIGLHTPVKNAIKAHLNV